jgi:antirestriction protein ArdC
MKKDLYAEVTARIVAQLETDVTPWIRPWSKTPGRNVPCNAATGRPYSGCNVILLWMAENAGYPTPRYLTFKQALALGGAVRKGEHGTKVYFFKRSESTKPGEDGADDETRSYVVIKEYTVFNVAQCDGLPDRVHVPSVIKVRNLGERDATIDEFLACTGADIREGGGRACYYLDGDYILMPPFAVFRGASDFYNTAFHEIAHWTRHRSRLDRDLRGRFDRHAYAAEELVAELTAAFLCAEFSLDGELQHASYMDHWIALLKYDTRAFFTVCSKAQAAADYLRGLALASSAVAAE